MKGKKFRSRQNANKRKENKNSIEAQVDMKFSEALFVEWRWFFVPKRARDKRKILG